MAGIARPAMDRVAKAELSIQRQTPGSTTQVQFPWKIEEERLLGVRAKVTITSPTICMNGVAENLRAGSDDAR
jgi:hypothetical protein